MPTRPKLQLVIGGSRMRVGLEDYVGIIAVVFALLAALLLWLGRKDEAVHAFGFLSGLLTGEVLRLWRKSMNVARTGRRRAARKAN